MDSYPGRCYTQAALREAERFYCEFLLFAPWVNNFQTASPVQSQIFSVLGYLLLPFQRRGLMQDQILPPSGQKEYFRICEGTAGVGGNPHRPSMNSTTMLIYTF